MSARLSVAVQAAAFDLAAETDGLRGGGEGAVASFVGIVRGEGRIRTLEIEHHPRMTRAAIVAIGESAARRWPLIAMRVVHRVGRLEPGEDIVFVGASSRSRGAALDAVHFVIDRLKTGVPLWKREHFADGTSGWVEARAADAARAARWD